MSWRSDGRDTCDIDGRAAASGTVDGELLARLLDEPYYRLAPPKSTGKELFNLAYLLTRIDGREIATEDLVATLTDLSAEVVATELARFDVTEVIAAGGGTLNPTLMGAIARRLPNASISTIEAFGIPLAAKEALLMALIGLLTVHGHPGTIPACTGAGRATVLGSIVPGSRALRLPAATAPPRRLVVRTPLAGSPEDATA